MPRTYGEGCPIACALDVVGERWALLVVRELVLGPLRYRDLLAAMPGIGTRILAERLKQLTAAGLIEARDLPPPISAAGYALTPRGAALGPVLEALAGWGWPLLPSGEGAPAPSPSSAALALWGRAAASAHRAAGQWRVELDGTPFVFAVRAAGVAARRGDAEHDGAARLSAGDAFALAGGALDVRRALRGGRLALAGALDAERFERTFSPAGSRA